MHGSGWAVLLCGQGCVCVNVCVCVFGHGGDGMVENGFVGEQGPCVWVMVAVMGVAERGRRFHSEVLKGSVTGRAKMPRWSTAGTRAFCFVAYSSGKQWFPLVGMLLGDSVRRLEESSTLNTMGLGARFPRSAAVAHIRLAHWLAAGSPITLRRTAMRWHTYVMHVGAPVYLLNQGIPNISFVLSITLEHCSLPA